MDSVKKAPTIIEQQSLDGFVNNFLLKDFLDFLSSWE